MSRARAERLAPGRLEDHRGRLFRAAYAMCGSREDAEDLVQETFERVLRRPRFIQRGRDLACLMRVLRHVWGAQLETRGRRRTEPRAHEDLEWIADRRADPGLATDARLAHAAILELSAPLRDTIVAVDIAGLSYTEAASALRACTGTIMSRLYRARQQVAAALEAS